MDAERRAWLTLALAEGIGPRTVARLLEHLGGVERAVSASAEELGRASRRGRGRALREALDRVRPEAVLRDAMRLGQRVLTPADADWPTARFAALPDPPLCLFARGNLPDAAPGAVAVVGTREAGHFGLRFARELAEDLAASGLTIVSGLALGVDAAAHAGALAAPGGLTVAVLGCGLDVAYPVEHVDLREEIAGRGALLAEHHPGTTPMPGFFPRRNRIVAALAQAVVVVEAPVRSGALLTARRALEMGREILVVPGPAGRASYRGGHHLLRRGEAQICEGARDVFEVLGREPLERGEGGRTDCSPHALPPPAGGAPLAVWGVLGEDEIASPDELCRRTGLSAGEIATALARLELDGRVARVPGVGIRRR